MAAAEMAAAETAVVAEVSTTDTAAAAAEWRSGEVAT